MNARSLPLTLLFALALSLAAARSGSAAELDPAAEQHYTSAFRYLRGEGVPRDPVRALEAFRRAAELGHPGAMREIGNAYAAGAAGLEQSWSEALHWWQRAAARGDPVAAFNAARVLEKGRDVPRDPAQAVALYTQASRAGYAPAKTNLAIMLYRGDGAPRDLARARALFLEAAEAGDRVAQYNAGVMLARGQGGRADPARARDLYRRAAEQDDALAQIALGRLLASGSRDPRELVEALFWYEVAILRNPKRAGSKVISERDRLRRRLSVADVETVQKRARSWRPRAAR